MRHRSKTTRPHRAAIRALIAFKDLAHAAFGAALLGLPMACVAAEAPAPARATSVDAHALVTELVKPGLYRIDGGGASATLVRVSPNGLIVVDAKDAGVYGLLMAELERIAKVSNPPIRALILTGSTRAQAGNADRFVDAGIPLIVQKNALTTRREAASTGASAAPSRVISYDTDYRLVSGGVVVEVEHVGRGRSGADSIVLFPDLRVAAVGELFTTDTPEPDCAGGGSFAGWAAAITHLLWLDFDLAVPSRGAPVGKRELVALKAKLEALAERSAGAAPQPGCRAGGTPP